MIVTTTFSVEGHQITEYLGLVRGIIVRTPTWGQGLMGGLKGLVGGRNQAFSDMCEQSRREAEEAMIEHARQLGADAVVGVSFDASDVGMGSGVQAAEVLCYGTAVKLRRA